MRKLDHLALPVADWLASRDWYVGTLRLTVEFEIPDRRTAAVRDGFDFTIFLVQAEAPARGAGVALWFQVDDVDATHAALSARGARFNHAPAKMFWGYGAELADPDGHLIRLWDETSMKAH
ncbi:VOC family protein [Vineibacter terrae]|uniref:VOC family protein n=1 Tax=Vineibacter terrae TaxID=2586908 RepID=UPI002E348753|nr:VOC family protein [Vineibacter terrae]HEX2886157.1 VOC family protein [Vineibacter terrae]